MRDQLVGKKCPALAGEQLHEIEFDPFVFSYFPVQKKASEESVPEEKDAADRELDISKGFKNLVAAYEQRLLKQALTATRYNQKRSAALLGLTYDQFRGLLRKYRTDLA